MHSPVKSLLLMLAIGSVSVSACAARSTNVIVDPAGVDMQAYQRDLAECHQLAAQVEPMAGRGAVGGAVVGGAIGGVIGGSDIAKKGAGVGAIRGTARGATATRWQRDKVVKNCMRNRSYSVLN